MRPYTVVNEKSIKVLIRILRGLNYNTWMMIGRTYTLQKQHARRKFEAKLKVVISQELSEELIENLEDQLMKHLRRNLWSK